MYVSLHTFNEIANSTTKYYFMDYTLYKNLSGFFVGTAIYATSLHAFIFYTAASIVDQRTITGLMECETF